MTTVTPEGPGANPLGMARRTLGITLLLVVVVLWTTSNFLGSVCAPFSQAKKPMNCKTSVSLQKLG
jgi:solute carrier family 35 protein F5